MPNPAPTPSPDGDSTLIPAATEQAGVIAAQQTLDLPTGPVAGGALGRLGPYRLLKLLGQGGMGFVYRAEDTVLHRAVALKVMRPEVAAKAAAKERFLREGRAAAKVRSDHVVTIYAVGEADGVPYMVLELLEGRTLDDWLAAGPAPAAVLAKVARDVLRGLAAAHAKGLVHRDIKPTNLWLEKGTNRVKLLDFGLTRDAGGSDQVTRDGVLVGTPAYMAPEQAAGGPLDGRSDLFSLGVVLYRMAAGANPFQRPDLYATLAALAWEEPKPLAEAAPAVPAALAAFVARLMAKKPGGRPASADAALADLAAIEKALRVATTPAAATPVPPPEMPVSQSPVAVDATITPPPDSPNNSGGGAKAPSRRKLLALGVLGVLIAAVAGFMVIKGTAKDGTVTELKVPDDSKIEIVKAPEPKKEVTGAVPTGIPPSLAKPPFDAEQAKAHQKAWAKHLGVAVESPTSAGGAMVLIPPGDGVPQPYYLGKYATTQAEWEKVMGCNPSDYSPNGIERERVKGMDMGRFPVERVSWFDCVEFCNTFSRKEGLKPYYELAVKRRTRDSIVAAEVKLIGGGGYRLPGGGEWEHGCRAGDDGVGKGEVDLADHAWYGWNSDGRTHPVGEKKPNGFGLFDMHGNVSTWTQEVPPGLESPNRAIRGSNSRIAVFGVALYHKYWRPGEYRDSTNGVRIARGAP